jgi:glycosyltransferase involved in cell wall biosynthesis
MSLVFVRGHIAYLKANGFEVGVLSSPGEELQRFADSLDIPAYSVEMPRRITPLRDLQAVVALWSALRRFKPAIVHAHTPKGGLLGMIAAWLARTPVRIYHIHGLPFITARGSKRFLLRWSEKVSCLLANQVLCVSDSIKSVAVREGLCSPKKIKVLANGSIGGIDALKSFNPSLFDASTKKTMREKYAIPVEDLVLGFVGRIVRDKGIVELIEAWNILKEEFPNLHLLMVGPFENQDPIPTDVEKQLREDTRVHLTGMVTEDISHLYSIMDLCVLPTYREGFPVMPLEAGAMGLPIIATKVPGCVDAIQDGVTGMLVPPYDSEALTVALRKYLSDPDLRQSHGDAARKRVLLDFKPEDIWEATYLEYVRLLKEKNFLTGTPFIME